MEQTTIIEISENPELMKCLEYLLQSDAGKTKDQIADHFNVSRATIYNWIMLWERSGIMERASEIFLVPKAEAIARAADMVVNETPKLLEGMIQIAKSDSSSRNRIDATEWLWSRIINPRMQHKENPGAQELNYVNARIASGRRIQPLAITDES